MKTIIAGGRTITDQSLINLAISNSGFNITEIVSGGCRGVDRLGEIWADANVVNKKIMPADWNKYGRAAGPIRNKQMAQYSDALIAIWDGSSHGTGNMIKQAKSLGLTVFVHKIAT